MLLTVFFIALVCLPFFIASKLKIIINLNNGKVVKDYVLFKRKIADLENIERVAEIDSTYGLYYLLVPKSNRFGKGYRITGYYSGKDKRQLIDFISKGLPLIEKRLSSVSVNEEVTDFKYYTEVNHNIFMVKPRYKVYQYFMLVFIAVLWVWYLGFSHIKIDWMWFAIIPAGIYILAISIRRYFDLNERCVVARSLWGVYSCKYYFNSFTDYLIEHNGRSPMAEGTVFYMRFSTKKGEKQIVLGDFGKSKHIDMFMAETGQLLC
jgi:hypothetical protein